MSKYETYKPSGIDWIGEVPEHWDRKKIGRCFQTIGSGTTPEAGKSDYYEEGTINWINTGDLNDGDIIECEKQITQDAFDKHSVLKIYPKGTILIALYGATIGKTGFLQIEGATNQACCALADSVYIIPRFTFYWTNAVKDYLITQSYGGGQPNISQDIIRQLRIYLPYKSEQLTIANYLDDQTQKIDRLIANKKAQAEKLKELRQIEINNAVTKGLNPDVEMKDSGIDWLGQIPKHWETNRLKNVTNINQEVITEKTSPDYELKYIDIGNVTSNGEFLELQEMTFSEAPSRARRKPKHNSIILSTVRTYLRAIAFVQNPDDNLIASTGFAVIDAYENLFDAKYLFYQMTSHIVVDRVIANSDGVSYPAISSTKLGDMKIILPPKEEQELISKYLEDRTNAIDKLIKNIETQIEKLQELRKIKIYEAVTGKIKVNAYE
ncbi:MAG: restriction endonuclease subunit S [Crocinitomicaceae bacterium]|nr:restriction endonuclease subunit S [Crocinitomicaceae bacterium]